MIFAAITIILIFGILIILHEAGHLLAARKFGMSVKEFSVGFGPTLLKKQGKETAYCLKLLPIGGSCDILEEEMNRVSPAKRTAVYLAGPAMNVAIAFIGTILAVIAGNGPAGIKNVPQALLTVFSMPLLLAQELMGTSIYDVGGIAMAAGNAKFSNMLASNPVPAILLLTALFSITLAAFNLLPLPPLDGGEALCTVIACFFGENRKMHRTVATVVWAVLITVNLIAVMNDAIYMLKGLIP